MKKLNRKLIAGTAMVATAAALAACGANPNVYGPPDMPETEVSIDDINTEPEEDVYGPPSMFGESEEDPEPPVYGPPADEGTPVQP